jgi:AmmeMemoRadiSam system protein B
MDASSFRPALRSLETLVVPDATHGRVLVLRDTQGISEAHAVLPPPLVPIVARFDGRATCAAIARQLSRESGVEIPEDLVLHLALELDQAFLLDSPRFRAERERIARMFRDAPVRPASHAGGAYHGNAEELRQYIDESCLGAGRAARGAKSGATSAPSAGHGKRKRTKPGANGAPPLGAPEPAASGAAVALIAPHIDPWRGAVCYGRAYGALAPSLAESVDTFIVLGTSHAPMREPFCICPKGFDTPFGVLPADEEACLLLAAAARFDPYADLLNHKREHSLEFQAVFLRYLLGDRQARIVPVLAGLGAHQARGKDPMTDPVVACFIDGLRELFEKRPGRVVIIAGADFAHVGPRFGDPAPYDATERAELEGRDRASLARARAIDAGGFWEHVAADLDTRRVCGLAPVWTLLATLEGVAPRAAGRLHHYEQTVDSEEGSIVSHAAMGCYAE